MKKRLIATVKDRKTDEFIIIDTTLDEWYRLKDAKRDLSQIGTIHKIIVREINEKGK